MLPMGYTKGVQVFDRVMRKVLQQLILRGTYEPFMDDVAAKPPSRSMNPDADGIPKISVIPGVLLYILEAIKSLDKV